MIAPHNPQCEAEPRVISQRDWKRDCCEQHAGQTDPRVEVAAKALALSANTRHGHYPKFVSHEHAYRCIAEALIAAFDLHAAGGDK